MACKTPAAKQFFAKKSGRPQAWAEKFLYLHTGKHPKAENDCHDDIPRHIRRLAPQYDHGYDVHAQPIPPGV